MKKSYEPTAEFILRKLYLLRNSTISFRDYSLRKQKKVVQELIKEGLVDNNLLLTSKSQLKLFKILHGDQINKFKEKLRNLGFYPNVLDYYLEMIDLEQRTLEIFDIERFEKFYEEFMRNPIPGFIKYNPLKANNPLFTEIRGSFVFACHPNQVFKTKLVSNVEPEIKTIEQWEIDKEKYDAATKIPATTQYDVLEHLANERQLLLKKKRNIPRHLVVVESAYGQLLARGIIKLDDDGYSYVSNPKYIDDYTQQTAKISEANQLRYSNRLRV